MNLSVIQNFSILLYVPLLKTAIQNNHKFYGAMSDVDVNGDVSPKGRKK